MKYSGYTPQDVLIRNNIFVAYADDLSRGVGTMETNITTTTIEKLHFLSGETHYYHLTSDSPAAGSGVYVGLDFDYDYSTRSDITVDAAAFINTDNIYTNGFEVNL